jgi:hypothetical protein
VGPLISIMAVSKYQEDGRENMGGGSAVAFVFFSFYCMAWDLGN